MVVDIDQRLTPYLFNLCVGFQARNETTGPQKTKKVSNNLGAEEKKDDSRKEDLDTSKSVARKPSKMGFQTPRSSKLGCGTITGQSTAGVPINALEPNEQQIELDCWHCATASYESGRITCQYV
jgi:hypothetical protein